MPVERHAQCPTCRRPVHLSEAELSDKRGFCAVCNRRFEITPDALGDPSSRLVEGPPLARIRVVPAGRGRHEWVWSPPRMALIFMVPFTAAWWGFLYFWYAHTGNSPVIFRIFPLIFVAAGLGMIGLLLWLLFGHERVAVRDGGLLWARGLGAFTRTRQLRLVDVNDVRLVERTGARDDHGHTSVHWHLQVAVRGGSPLELGKGMGFERDHLEWLREHLLAAIRGTPT